VPSELALQTLQARLALVVGERHRGRDAGMDLAYLLEHLERDCPICRMPFTARAKLDQVHRLAGVQVKQVTDPVLERDRVRSLVDEPLAAQPLVFAPADLEALLISVAKARGLYLLGHVSTALAAEPLPLAGEHAMPLQISERSVVGDHLEAVAKRLEPAARAVASVAARADELSEQGRALLRPEPRDCRAERVLAGVARLVEARGEQVLLRALRANQPHRRTLLGAIPEAEALGYHGGSRAQVL
jgi:hypothetical protein